MILVLFVLCSPFLTAAALAAAVYVTLPWIDDES
jgi:hypothetical protein